MGCMVLFLSCSAEDGQDGAIGPQGEQGPTGPQGEQGETGAANVMYSDWITVPGSAWNPSSGISTRIRTATISAPEITQEYLDTGVILVYGKKIIWETIMPNFYLGRMVVHLSFWQAL